MPNHCTTDTSEKFKENIHTYLLIYTINRTIIIISTIPTAVVVIAHALTFLLFSTSSYNTIKIQLHHLKH